MKQISDYCKTHRNTNTNKHPCIISNNPVPVTPNAQRNIFAVRNVTIFPNSPMKSTETAASIKIKLKKMF